MASPQPTSFSDAGRSTTIARDCCCDRCARGTEALPIAALHHSASSGLRISHVVLLESARLLLERVSLFLSRAGPRCRLDLRCGLDRSYSFAPTPEFPSPIVGPARAIGHVILGRITTCRMRAPRRLRRYRFTRPKQLLMQQRLME